MPFRFIETDPADLLDLGTISEIEVLHDWQLGGSSVVEGSDPNPPLFDRQLNLDSDQVHIISVDVGNMPYGTLALRWRTSTDGYSRDRQIQMQAEHLGAGAEKNFRFDVSPHPLWSGSITGLRLYTGKELRESVAPFTVQVLRRSLDAGRLEKATSRAWKVNLDHEIRNAFLALPGSDIVRKLQVPSRAKLILGYGLQSGLRQAVEYRVLVNTPSEEGRVLYSETLDGASPASRGWHNLNLDLGEFSGREVELVLQTRIEGQFHPATGFPLWANPEVVGALPIQFMPNVILVSIDTLRADHLSLYGYERRTSPRLDTWSDRRAVVFENAVAQAPSTLPSHFSMFTGLDAFRHGVNHDPGPASLKTLSEILRRAGYKTLARTAGGYMHPAYGLLQGFDIYRYWLEGYDRMEEFPRGIEVVKDWIFSNKQRPFFLFFHTYEVHAPYRARQPYFSDLTGHDQAPQHPLWISARHATQDEGFRPRRGTDYRFGGSEPVDDSARAGSVNEAIDLYDSAIGYVDEEVSGLFDLLEELELDQQTLVVVTSDHGESFGEHELAGHGYLYDDNLMVPLIVKFPEDRFAGQRVNRQVRSIDVLPTILDTLGLEAQEEIDGQSLVPLLKTPGGDFPDEAWSYAANDNFGVALRVGNRRKYIFNDAVWPQIFAHDELYSLSDDPKENNDISDSSTSTNEMRRSVQSRLARQGTGLIVRLANQQPVKLTGELGGDWVGQTRIKSVQMPCSCLVWQEDGSIRFEVLPSSRYDLLVDANPTASGWIRIQLEDGGLDPATTFQHPLLLSELNKPLTFRFEGGLWVQDPTTSPDLETGVQFFWRGRHSDEGVDLSSAEADLVRQMKALGYIQ